MNTQFCIILPLEKIALGDEYSSNERSLPLHCTVMPWITMHPDTTMETVW